MSQLYKGFVSTRKVKHYPSVRCSGGREEVDKCRKEEHHPNLGHDRGRR